MDPCLSECPTELDTCVCVGHAQSYQDSFAYDGDTSFDGYNHDAGHLLLDPDRTELVVDPSDESDEGEAENVTSDSAVSGDSGGSGSDEGSDRDFLVGEGQARCNSDAHVRTTHLCFYSPKNKKASHLLRPPLFSH